MICDFSRPRHASLRVSRTDPACKLVILDIETSAITKKVVKVRTFLQNQSVSFSQHVSKPILKSPAVCSASVLLKVIVSFGRLIYALKAQPCDVFDISRKFEGQMTER